MSSALLRVEAWEEARVERVQHWFAVVFSVLLHALMLVVLLYASVPVVTSPQSAESGSRVRVDFIGEPDESEDPVPTTETPPPQAPSTETPPPAASRVQSTLVDRSENPVPPPAPTMSDTPGERRAPRPVTPRTRPSPPAPSADAVQSRVQTTATRAPSSRRRPETWTGRPPGLLPQDTAPDNAGASDSPAIRNGRGRDVASEGPSMELGGYLVYYDVLSEARLRTWAAQGMKELSIPLPGTRYYMVCPLEIALKRGSGKCRALDPDSPEMAAIGDAREAVTMLQVYKQGELVWRGPGPYR